MIFRIEDLKKVCNDILYAVDNQSTFDNENVEIVVEGGEFKLNVTNAEYFVTVTLPIDSEETFNATVNATLFLRLISQLTTDTVEILSSEKYLIIKGNGEYKIPLIYDGESMLHLRKIELASDSITNSVNISSDILNSILMFNAKELTKGNIVKPVQKLFYMDNDGAITFTSGACVNSFHIDSNFSILLTQKIVKLFKLFSDNTSVTFSIGTVPNFGSNNLMGVEFKSSGIVISAILPDSTMLTSVPVTQIRNLAEELQKYSVVLNRKNFSDALSRLMLFSTSDVNAFGKFKCLGDRFVISLTNSTASEEFVFESSIDCDYSMLLNLKDLKSTVDTYPDMYITMWFGNSTSITLGRGNVKNVIPECLEV